MKQARAEALFAAIHARDGGRCVYCGVAVVRRGPGLHRTPNLATLDHVIPRSQGGPTRAENLVLACAACNNARGVEDAESFRARRGETHPPTSS
ncbi:HNH endonuclease [Salinarimonas soli]|uniref:HNH endonuclease n=1 Tax=Salinarimonas soli TaxID=1638099 RepID=UPI001AEDDF85|nr:HNH endonuclease signature motif containing protein [Salinarimonas soli]